MKFSLFCLSLHSFHLLSYISYYNWGPIMDPFIIAFVLNEHCNQLILNVTLIQILTAPCHPEAVSPNSVIRLVLETFCFSYITLLP